MPRPPRLLLSQSYYHIMTRGNNKNIVFRKDDDYLYYLSLISRYKAEHLFELYHYCLMPTHVHLLVKTNKASDFSNFMKKLNLAYFHYYRRKYTWVGHFWQGRFKSQPVGKDAYFIQCGKYIEINSVRKGLVKTPEDYKYSSYSYYAKGLPDSLITEDIFYADLGENQNERQKSYQDLIINDLISSSYLKQVWGSGGQRYNEARKIQHHL
jgi:putative transposase